MIEIKKGCVMNAACSIAKSKEDIENLISSDSDLVVVGSITVMPKEPNPPPNWHATSEYGLNSYGMPNKGINWYKTTLPPLVKKATEANKEIILSIGGSSSQDYVQLAKFAEDIGIGLIEANFGCPNIEQGEIASFNIKILEEYIKAILDSTKNIGLVVKLSPYTNPKELAEVADLLTRIHKENNRLIGITLINTLPNALMPSLDDPTGMTKLAGMSGKAIKPFALGQIKQFRGYLPDSMLIVGVGGIENRKDVEDYIEAGAHAVQTATYIVREGVKAISNLKKVTLKDTNIINKFRNRILNEGVLDSEAVHHEFVGGMHGRKLDFDKIKTGSQFYEEWVSIVAAFVKDNYEYQPDIVIGVANGANRLAINVAAELEGVIGLMSEKGPNRSLRLSNSAEDLAKNNNPGFVLVVEDVGTSGSSSFSLVKEIKKLGVNRVEVLNTWQRSHKLEKLTEEGIKYKSIILEPMPMFEPKECKYCKNGLELIKR